MKTLFKPKKNKSLALKPHVVKLVKKLGNSHVVVLSGEDRQLLNVTVGDKVTVFGGI